MAELVLRLREREMHRIPILNTRITIGRDPACDLVIDNAGVSRTHAILIYVDQKYRIRDNDSQNGLTVNGEAVKDARITYGDVIGFGKFEVELVQTEEEYQLQPGAQPRGKTTEDVIETVEMGSDQAIRARDEAIANAEAKQAAKAAAQRETQPMPRAPVVVKVEKNDVTAIIKLAGFGLLAVIVLIGAALFFLSRK